MSRDLVRERLAEPAPEVVLGPPEARRPAVALARIRVLHVVHDLEYGGLQRLTGDIVRNADADAFEFHVLSLGSAGPFAAAVQGVAPLHPAPRMSRGSLLWPRGLAATIRGIAPDVVHSHSGVWYKASLAARLAGVQRVVHTDHGRAHPDPWRDRLIERLAARRTDTIVAVSEPLARDLARGVVKDPSRITVIPNGIDVRRFAPTPDTGALRRELGLPPTVPILCSVGRLEPVKGYDTMVEAFARLLAGWSVGEPPVLVLAGDGTARPRLERLLRVQRVGDRVRLLGWRDDVHALHAASCLFTLSSRSEGTSLSLLEAMSAGLCPVVTRVGGNAAVLGDALRHRLVAPDDPEALARAWADALGNPDRRASDGTAARARVRESWSLEGMVAAYERLYRATG